MRYTVRIAYSFHIKALETSGAYDTSISNELVKYVCVKTDAILEKIAEYEKLVLSNYKSL